MRIDGATDHEHPEEYSGLSTMCIERWVGHDRPEVELRIVGGWICLSDISHEVWVLTRLQKTDDSYGCVLTPIFLCNSEGSQLPPV